VDAEFPDVNRRAVDAELPHVNPRAVDAELPDVGPRAVSADGNERSRQLFADQARGTRVPVDDKRLRRFDNPSWFSEAFESDGYDTETLSLVLSRPAKSPPLDQSAPKAQAPPPITTTGDRLPEGWTYEVWPADVRLLAEQFNPSHCFFPSFR
jgi:hypothetical protein